MKPKPALLSPLLKSDTQGLILARIFMSPELDFSITHLAEFAGTSVPTAMREVDRLVESDLVTDKTLGRVRLIQANREHRLFDSIYQIVAYSYGPAAILPSVLVDLFGLQRAFIYGSWAARLAQQSGPEPKDVDVLLVGNMNRIAAAKAAAQAESIIGRTVTVQFASNFDWDKAESAFIQNVKSSPLLELNLVF